MTMVLVYLGYNCLQRGFDNPGQVRIQLEALACQEIFLRAEEGLIKLVWSLMQEDETIFCPFPERQLEALRLATLCKIRFPPGIRAGNCGLILCRRFEKSASQKVTS